MHAHLLRGLQIIQNECSEHFFFKLFAYIKKMLYLCAAVPVIPLPDIVLVKNPGFYFIAMSELEILSSAFSAQRLSKYVYPFAKIWGGNNKATLNDQFDAEATGGGFFDDVVDAGG